MQMVHSLLKQLLILRRLKYYARGIVGSSNGQSLHTEETLTRVGGIYAGASIPVA